MNIGKLKNLKKYNVKILKTIYVLTKCERKHIINI